MIKKQAYDVKGLQQELQSHPQVWDIYRHRTESPTSPHRETSDIWARYNAFENFHGDVKAFNDEHVSSWYPVIESLPEAKSLAERVAKDMKALSIGGVLITRIQPGKRVYPHADKGWHAQHYEKFALQVKGDDKQAFHFEGEDLVTEDGDLFWFDNAYPHWVTNESDRERITMVICLRRLPCPG
jgi:hypothetical protein